MTFFPNYYYFLINVIISLKKAFFLKIYTI